MSRYHGHVTLDDGSHVPLTAEQAEALLKAAKEAEEKSAADMPRTSDAVRVMQRGRERLRRLGWREAQHCPKDGSAFAVIQYGSTGIFDAVYAGSWPSGHIYCCDFLCHPEGMLFKPMSKLTDDERETLAECMRQEKAAFDRQMHGLIGTNQEDG